MNASLVGAIAPPSVDAGIARMLEASKDFYEYAFLKPVGLEPLLFDYATAAQNARLAWQHLAESTSNSSKSLIDSIESQRTFLQEQGAALLVSQQNLWTIDWPAIESSPLASTIARLENVTSDLGINFNALIRDAIAPGRRVFPRVVYDLSPLGVAAHANFIRAWIDFEERASGESEAQEKSRLWHDELRHRVATQLPHKLRQIHRGLPKMWAGALETLRSNSSDRLRQSGVSVRELFDHLLRQLSPDAEVRKWTSDPGDYNGKKPTRGARIRYVCRNVKVPSYSDFTGKLVTLALANFDDLQSVTHGIESSLDEVMLESLYLAIGCNLLLLIDSAAYED